MEDRNTVKPGQLSTRDNSLDNVGSKSIESDKVVNRILVFGSTLSGAFDLQASLQDHLVQVGIENPSVQVVRNAASIEDAIYDKEWSVPESRPENDKSDKPTLPRGVVILPEMRQYSGGMGMTIPTYGVDSEEYSPFALIKRLCEENNIPYIDLRSNFTQGEFDQKMKALLAPKPSLKPAEE